MLEGAARSEVEEGAGMIAGAEDEIDRLLFDVGLAAVEADLPASLQDAPATFDHGEPSVGGLVVEGLRRESGRGLGSEGAAHAGALKRCGDGGVAGRAGGDLSVGVRRQESKYQQSGRPCGQDGGAVAHPNYCRPGDR